MEDRRLERYAKWILRKIGEEFQIQIKVQVIEESMKEKYFSKINKSGIYVDGSTFIESATISLNYRKLNTRARVRRAISHELAHLFPGKEPFTKRWSFWNNNLKYFEENLKQEILDESKLPNTEIESDRDMHVLQ